MLPLRERVIRRLSGQSEANQRARWHRDGRTYDFEVPGDNLWICVKDDLLLREYEWMGVCVEDAAGTVIDAGAHVGTFSAIAATHARQVVAIEPNPDNLELLRRNLHDNSITNVEILPAALWSEPGEVGMALDGPTSAGSVVADGDGAVTVTAIGLEDLVARLGPIDLLKIDIEGAEFEVLGQASVQSLRQIDVIVGELHLWAADDDTLNRLVTHLGDAGFEVEVRRGPIHHPGSALRSLRRNWSSLEGHHRLKWAVAGSYGLAAVVRHIPGLRRSLAAKELRLFVARRST